MEKYLVNLGTLTENELDFHNWCLDNVEKIIDQKVSDLAKDYGTGISFIYRFFAKLQLKNLKDFIFYLGYTKSLTANDPQTRESNATGVPLEFEFAKVSHIIEVSNQKTISLLQTQRVKLLRLVEDIHDRAQIFLIGFGYSGLAIEDFIEFYRFLDNELVYINDVQVDYLQKLKRIKPNSLVIIYSARARNKKFYSWVRHLKTVSPTIKIYLVTTNPNNFLVKYLDEMIEIDSLSKRVDSFKEMKIISPIENFVTFNNFVKSVYFKKYTTDVLKSRKLKAEIASWHDYKLSTY